MVRHSGQHHRDDRDREQTGGGALSLADAGADMLHVKPAALKSPERGDTDHALDDEGSDCTGHASLEDLLRTLKAAGMHRAKQIAAAAMAMPDVHEALDRIISIFCDFWDFDPSLGKLHAATSLDAEFGRALAERNERRRKLFTVLVERMAGDVSAVRRRDVVDLMFVLTSQPTYASLRKGRSKRAVCDLIREACSAALGAPGQA